MTEVKIEKFFCNGCKRKTNHFIRGEHTRRDDDGEFWRIHRLLIIECRGCENLALVKAELFSEWVESILDPHTDDPDAIENWEEEIYPPVTYRPPPPWFEDLPDGTLRDISAEIYKSLQTDSHYLATFGSRTLIDRLIVLTIGEQASFQKGLQALEDAGKLSPHERKILEPVINAGNAAAHRGWAPTKEQIAVILDTVEGLIHRLLVLPKLADELKEAVPGRSAARKAKAERRAVTVNDKNSAEPNELCAVYDELAEKLRGFGDDVAVLVQKHYTEFRRNRNFASVQIYNQKCVIRVYLNLDPDTVDIDDSKVRDVRQIGHYGTGHLEISINTKKDIEKFMELFKASYDAS